MLSRRTNNEGACPPTLEELIADYMQKRAAWLDTAAQNGDLVADGEHFSAYEKAGRAVLRYPCNLMGDIPRKISLVLEETDLYTRLKEDEDRESELLRVFLSSIIAQFSAID